MVAGGGGGAEGRGTRISGGDGVEQRHGNQESPRRPRGGTPPHRDRRNEKSDDDAARGENESEKSAHPPALLRSYGATRVTDRARRLGACGGGRRSDVSSTARLERGRRACPERSRRAGGRRRGAWRSTAARH